MNTSILKLSLASVLLAVSFTATADDDAAEKTYKEACGVCHDAGVANSPKLGDKEAWAPRIEKGIDALYETSIKGKGAMPAKGGRANLSDDAVKAVVDYMVSKAK